MNKDLISIIVPCYNVSKYVSKCLDSLINQTYKNIEIILVDDCSNDNTRDILKEYLKKDNRIKLICNKKNSGLSFSRNVGISNSSGQYIGFIDSDDYVDFDFYEKLYCSMDSECDISMCDFKVINEFDNSQVISKCFSGDKIDKLSAINTGLAASVCNKLFRRDLILSYDFEVGKVNEDIAVTIPLIVKARKIGYAKTYYYYIQRNNSIQNSVFSYKRFDIFSGVDLALERIEGCSFYNDIKDAIVFNQLIALFLYVIPKEKRYRQRKRIIKKYCDMVKKYDIRHNSFLILFFNNNGPKHRLYYKTLFKLVYGGHYRVVNFLLFVYDFLRGLLIKDVIDEGISLNSVIDKAIYQGGLRENNVKVSVVIPNYNYSRFIYQRVYSILSQNYKIHELIILDDCSTDDSRIVIDEMVSKIDSYVSVKKIYNKKNSGSAFKQWEKGFEIASGDYVWIAEADDYCNSYMLNKLVKPIRKNRDIMISYCDTAFIDSNGYIIMKSIKNEIDIQKSGHWNRSYINNGIDEIDKYSYLNNTIANVSSCLIKNCDYGLIFSDAGKFYQAGDWLIYLYIMSKGYISYINKAMNFYRVHGNNVSSTMNRRKHIDEIKRIYSYCISNFNLTDQHKKKMDERINFLIDCWEVNDEKDC